MIVSEDIGVGGIEEEREESGECAGKFSCPAENGESEEECDEYDGKPRKKCDVIGIISHAKEELIAKTPLGEPPCFCRSFGVLRGVNTFVALTPQGAWHWKLRQGRNEKHGEPGEVFDERRVLGIDAHVEEADVAIGRRNMRFLIHGGGIIPGESKRNGAQCDQYAGDKPYSVFFQEFHRSNR